MTRTSQTKSVLRERGTIVRLAVLAAIALSTAGCNLTAKKDVSMTSSIPTDYRLRHPITIQEREASLEVFVGERRGGLNPTQRGDIHSFANQWRAEATGGVLIDVPHRTPNSRSAAETAREVRAALGQAGVPGRAIAIRRYTPQDGSQLATVRIRYPRMAAQAGPCGFWPEDLGLAHDAQPTMNRPFWNHGCTSQRNLAAQVANPADLVQPRGEAPIYAARRRKTTDIYRQMPMGDFKFEKVAN
jgi:pilus assembly protein CpaD